MNPYRRVVLAPLLSLGLVGVVAASEAGRISSVDGAATVLRGSERLPAKSGLMLQAGDVVITGEQGSVQWMSLDESVMVLAPNSRLTIDSYSWGGGSDASHYSLKGGGLGVISGGIQAPAYKLSTSAGDITVNGTQYNSVVCAGNCAGFADGMYVVVGEGAVTVSNSAGSLAANAGQSVFVAGPDAAPVLTDKAPTLAVSFGVESEFGTDEFGDVLDRGRFGPIVVEPSLSAS